MDSDLDGLNNTEEYWAGTDPQDRNSVLQITGQVGEGQVALQFTAISNRTYTVEFRDSLDAGNWQPLFEIPATATTGTLTLTNSLDAGVYTRFYRVLLSR